jgi:hypothetical protein
VLAYPRVLEDIRELYDDIMEDENERIEFPPGSVKATGILGQIGYAATQQQPLLVIGTGSGRLFIHFIQIKGILSEDELESPCSFQLMTDVGDYRFRCDTSVDYIKWINALNYAYDASKGGLNMKPMMTSIDLNEKQGQPLKKSRGGSARPSVDESKGLMRSQSVKKSVFKKKQVSFSPTTSTVDAADDSVLEETMSKVSSLNLDKNLNVDRYFSDADK